MRLNGHCSLHFSSARTYASLQQSGNRRSRLSRMEPARECRKAVAPYSLFSISKSGAAKGDVRLLGFSPSSVIAPRQRPDFFLFLLRSLS